MQRTCFVANWRMSGKMTNCTRGAQQRGGSLMADLGSCGRVVGAQCLREHRQSRCRLVRVLHCQPAVPSRRGSPFVPSAAAALLGKQHGRWKHWGTEGPTRCVARSAGSATRYCSQPMLAQRPPAAMR
ncbi:hypothetical protein BD310DRAFT_309121 [Dichomitus squalens]|uniref:Uncharacterized protein n=1 Tax=Dichomitus squalens TaxID=114155 RepID=A0A4Q9Q0H0_9APHY|nr:hypothetical protein BD310DRAFT_309121 [Dichomitus squalens]